MRKKYLSALLFGALLFASAGTFTSCKDYDDDIDNLQNQISANASAIEALKKVVDNGDYVTGVEKSADGLTITFKNAGPKTITLEDKVGSVVTINENGYLCIDGKATDITAAAATEEKKDQIIIENGMWSVLQEDGTYKSTGIPVSGVTVTGSEAAGYVLTIINADGTQVVKLPTASSTISSITVASALTIGSTSAIGGTGATGCPWNIQSGNITWAGPKGNVVKDQLLYGPFAVVREAVSVTPASVDLAAQTLTLVDTKGNVAPVKVIVTPHSTDAATEERAASVDGKWNLTVVPTADLTKDNVKKVFGEWNTSNKYIANLYALFVNGVAQTPYDIAIKVAQTETAETATVTANIGNLTYKNYKGETISGFETSQTRIRIASGTSTDFAYSQSDCYDSYLSFDGTMAAKAAAYGVTANGMTINVPESAKGKTDLNATLHILGVSGKQTTLIVPLNLAGTTAGTVELATTNVKILPNTAEIKIDLSNAFSDMSEAEIESVDKLNWITLTEVANQDNFLLSSVAPTYYDKDDNQVISLNGQDLRVIKYAKLTVSGNIANDAKPGDYKLSLKLYDNEPAYAIASVVRDITVPVSVTLPTFDELFPRTNKWNEGAFNVTLTNYDITDSSTSITTHNPAVNFTQAFTGQSGALTSAITYDIDKVNDVDVKLSQSNGIVALKKIQNDNKELAVKTIQATASYKIADKDGLTVKSEKFTTNLKSIFEGVALKFIVDDVAQDVAVVNANNLIPAYYKASTTDAKGNGLAVVRGTGEGSITALITGNKVDGLKLTWNNSSNSLSTVSDVFFSTPKVEGLSLTPSWSGNDIKLEGINNGDAGQLVVTFTDYTGIVTKLKIDFKKN